MSATCSLFDRFNDLNILIVGDVMIDRYLWGTVNRISPEAPVPVVHLKSDNNRLGGAANVALNIKAMGATPYLCSVIGQDQNATIFLDLLPIEGIPTIGIIQSPERITTVKTRVISGAQHLLRIDEEQTNSISENESQKLLSNIQTLLEEKRIDVILFQDYDKGVLHPKIIDQIIKIAKARDIPTVVDPKAQNFLAYHAVDLFKPNLKEVDDALPFTVSGNQQSLSDAAEFIHKKLANRFIMITLSEKGIFLASNGKNRIIPTQTRQIADVCGAGDTVISMAALGLGAQLNIDEIALLANLAGGQVCEKIGVVPVDKKQLEQEYIELIAKSS